MDNNEKKPLPKKSGPKKATSAAKNLKANARLKTGKQKRITELERRFVEDYILHYNGTRAALNAGYSKLNSPSTASALLKKPHIVEMIKAKQAEVSSQIIVTKDMITQELFGIAFADYTEILDIIQEPDGKGGMKVSTKFKPTALLQPGVGKLIKSMKMGRDGKVEVTLFSKETALDKLAMHIDYYNAHNKSLPISSTQIYIPDNGRGDVLNDNLPPVKP